MAGPASTLWHAVLDPAWHPPETWRNAPPLDAAARLADLVTPALAAFLLGPLSDRLSVPLIDADAAHRSRLMNRLNGEVQRRWMAEIADSGVPVICMKGFVFAHSLYPDPDIRTIGDLDLLVAESDLDRLLGFLTARGFGFAPLPAPRWGFISDASFLPLMSADGACNIDLHVQPDCYPAYRSLSADRVRAHMKAITVGGLPVNVPSPAHALVLCLTNAAKDKFGPFSVRKLVDIAMLLRSDEAVDWDEVRALAGAGHFTKPARVVFALLIRLGLPAHLVPGDLQGPPAGLAAPVFDRLAADYAAMFPSAPPSRRVLAREVMLCTEPDVALHNALLRLKGLFRPGSGLPEGYTVRQ
jgi:hypothetical protein